MVLRSLVLSKRPIPDRGGLMVLPTVQTVKVPSRGAPIRTRPSRGGTVRSPGPGARGEARYGSAFGWPQVGWPGEAPSYSRAAIGAPRIFPRPGRDRAPGTGSTESLAHHRHPSPGGADRVGVGRRAADRIPLAPGPALTMAARPGGHGATTLSGNGQAMEGNGRRST